jgi:hypothetical protein
VERFTPFPRRPVHPAISVPNALVRVHFAQVIIALGDQINLPGISLAAGPATGSTKAAPHALVHAGPTRPHARPRPVLDYEMRET